MRAGSRLDIVLRSGNTAPEDHGGALEPRSVVVEKAVCYVIADEHLLVFTHDDQPMDVTGVQVPAGTIRAGETPADAAVRELHEETGAHGRILRSLGAADYDLAPMREEIARRHFFVMSVDDPDITAVWLAGENDSSAGSARHAWTCRWIPLQQAHVLAAGLGAKLGEATRSPLQTDSGRSITTPL